MHRGPPPVAPDGVPRVGESEGANDSAGYGDAAHIGRTVTCEWADADRPFVGGATRRGRLVLARSPGTGSR